MPFIPKKERVYINASINGLIAAIKKTAEEDYELKAKLATYSIYVVLVNLYKNGNWYKMGDVDKILDSVKKVFDAEYVYPYEVKAKKRNGGVNEELQF